MPVELNSFYFSPHSKAHPLVRGQYALDTPAISEFFAIICDWIDNRVPGGYVWGYSRYGKTRALQFWIGKLLAARYNGLLPLFVVIYKQHDDLAPAKRLP
jgi:hypothetical protein